MEHKTKLSKGILDLKFMKRSKEKFMKEEAEEEREHLYSEQLSSLQTGAQYVSIVPSHFDCYEYLPCRLSFGGYEPETEKINLEKLKGLYAPLRLRVPAQDTDQEGMEVDVPASNMNNFMNSCPDGEEDKKRSTFVHKQSKANRFDPKPPKKKPQQKFNSNNKKFDDQKNKKQGGNFNKKNQGNNKFNNSFSNRGKNSSSGGDKRGVKRASDQFQQNDFEDPPKSKVFKQPA